MHKSLLAVAILFSSGLAMASTIAVSGVSGSFITAGDPQLYGWIFSTNADVTITSLGVFDRDSNGLADSHDVGIYRQSSQLLLTSATVPSGSTGFLDSGFRFVNLGAPVVLSADTYVIVMTMPTLTDDAQLSSVTSFSSAGEITWISSAFDSSSVLAFPNPDSNGSYGPGIFGPNFLFDAGAIPEPSTALLVVAGIVGILVRRQFARRTG